MSGSAKQPASSLLDTLDAIMRDSRSWNQTKAVDACMNEDDLGEAVRQGSLVKERIKAMNYAAEVAGLFDREPHPRSRNGRRR